MRVTTLHAAVEVEGGAAGSTSTGLELGEQCVTYARRARRVRRDEVVDVELADRCGVRDKPPAGDADAAVAVVGREKAQALRVALRVDGGERLLGQMRAELDQHG